MKLLVTGDTVVREPLTSDPFSPAFKELMARHQYRITNFEAPLSTTTGNKHRKKGPSIQQEKGIELFTGAEGFNICCLANNHIMDNGAAALEATINHLHKQGVQTLGAGATMQQAYEPLLLEQDGVKLALVNAGEAQFGCLQEDQGKPGYTWCLHQQIYQNIRQCKQQGYRVIVLPHAGLEGFHLPLPEWRGHYKSYIDAGADLVLASHPHIIQGKEAYGEGLIYYSLGNFFFNVSGRQDYWYSSVALSITVKDDGCVVDEEYLVDGSNNHIELASSAQQLLQERSALLVADKYTTYLDEVTRECVKQWEQVHKYYYAFLVQERQLSGIKKLLARLIQPLVRRTYKGNDELMTVHNIRIESNRYVCERALLHKNQTY